MFRSTVPAGVAVLSDVNSIAYEVQRLYPSQVPDRIGLPSLWNSRLADGHVVGTVTDYRLQGDSREFFMVPGRVTAPDIS